MPRDLTFTCIDIGGGTDGTWRDLAQAAWPGWADALVDGALEPAGQAASLAMFDEHMPELIGVRDRLAAEIDRPGAAAVLTHTGLRSPFSGCSQAAVDGALVRNYDFSADMCDRQITRSDLLRPVIGMGDVPCGMLDGMNDAGLAVSLTFGGRPVHGPGFTVLLVTRYLLETCSTVDEAWERVRRLPIATAQNLTFVDRERSAAVFLGPDREPLRLDDACVTNHQDLPVSAEQEAESATQLRLATLLAARDSAGDGEGAVDAAITALLTPPLYQTHDWGTLYTAAYRPRLGRVDYHWPGDRLTQSFEHFTTGAVTVGRG
ncbi:putative choloylglycine hydrolase [Allocatelliglobosispora scoriae]|uniref:Putative choloylglycine hydrolase n=1 Tax=Allocatelliglobosispora scoriae TaxID=643052 RepID=A0A841BPT5_9ACTN|nr:C45 family peptidase [Allocatelliglobosispora scoriae]MBB5868762.1 putative choloylglycine hydrolase [Allocatelliglobosispora scoriae]